MLLVSPNILAAQLSRIIFFLLNAPGNLLLYHLLPFLFGLQDCFLVRHHILLLFQGHATFERLPFQFFIALSPFIVVHVF